MKVEESTNCFRMGIAGEGAKGTGAPSPPPVLGLAVGGILH